MLKFKILNYNKQTDSIKQLAISNIILFSIGNNTTGKYFKVTNKTNYEIYSRFIFIIQVHNIAYF